MVLLKPVITPSLPLITTGVEPAPTVMLSAPTVVVEVPSVIVLLPAVVVLVLLPSVTVLPFAVVVLMSVPFFSSALSAPYSASWPAAFLTVVPVLSRTVLLPAPSSAVTDVTVIAFAKS